MSAYVDDPVELVDRYRELAGILPTERIGSGDPVDLDPSKIEFEKGRTFLRAFLKRRGDGFYVSAEIMGLCEIDFDKTIYLSVNEAMKSFRRANDAIKKGKYQINISSAEGVRLELTDGTDPTYLQDAFTKAIGSALKK